MKQIRLLLTPDQAVLLGNVLAGLVQGQGRELVEIDTGNLDADARATRAQVEQLARIAVKLVKAQGAAHV